MNLPLMSALFTTFALTLYVMLDGFDLGVGALLLVQPTKNCAIAWSMPSCPPGMATRRG